MRHWITNLLHRGGGRPLDCHQVGELLQRYLDGNVDGAEAKAIAAHLEDCRRCGLEAETYLRIKSALAATRPEVPAESIQRLRQFAERLARGEEPSRP